MSKTTANVHILGAGAMGSLLAHDLKQQFPQDFHPTLLVKPGKSLDSNTQTIKLARQIGPNWTTDSVTVDALKPSDFLSSVTKYEKSGHIDNLIISTKAHQTASALLPFIPYISEKSNILIVQNGMGIPSLLKEKFWARNCPNIYEVVATHGAYIDDDGVVRHAAPGKLTIAKFPGENKQDTPAIVQMLLDTPTLNATLVDYEQFLVIQCEKLVVNCCINPLSALFDCFNGELLYGGDQLSSMYKRIINEAITVLYLEYPMLNQITEASIYLNPERLFTHVVSTTEATAKNSSSMRQDVRMLRLTEVDNMNGYISYLGKKHKSGTLGNAMICDLVKMKLAINKGVNQATTDSLLDISLK
ncbi:uncharacterized protein SPAPADRAFT_63055 [Spathaspora passalidarum NRRL Y-27907]|uniref:2-dehydropantoate 2-reductase n=1 Tax=Spathaspora passalidarum (strain NRRL Y-27907 / 11-Y1) TaxID=619300 RepID=G3ASS5_SPAPN|nr:uncharacterized protein SPAPADRAFT_63055 [Spathaspora passalidarum NRRL Y-27907]EGW31139.1 hypothetical protein SPAPADRAFT_63055 [Spathaspora passalidarum NRRL Y-27907]